MNLLKLFKRADKTGEIDELDYYAARNGPINPLKLLIAKGSDINSRGKKEETPLHWSVSEGYDGISKLLTRHSTSYEVSLGFQPR